MLIERVSRFDKTSRCQTGHYYDKYAALMYAPTGECNHVCRNAMHRHRMIGNKPNVPPLHKMKRGPCRFLFVTDYTGFYLALRMRIP
jgi:hypothetical protein